MSIRRRGGDSWQVRVSPFPAQTVPTEDVARRLELQLKLRRIEGAVVGEEPTTLGEEIDGLLSRLVAGGDLDERSIEFYEQKAKVWKPLRGVKVSALRRAQVEDFVMKRASAHPRSALDELQFVKRVLRKSRDRGQKVDVAIFGIEGIRHSPRRGRALTVEQLYELASWFPEHVSRMVLLAGQVGARQSVWFGLTEDLLDLSIGAMTVPVELSKSRREQRIFLTSTEIGLFREQLMARAPGVSLVFPRPDGRMWDRGRFGELWRKGREAATKNDLTESGVETSVYDGFRFHWLRHTAGSLMALAEMDPAVASERLGHSDGGSLFLRTYRHLYEGEKRTQAAKLDALVRSSLDRIWPDAQVRGANALQEPRMSMGAPGIEPGTSRV